MRKVEDIKKIDVSTIKHPYKFAIVDTEDYIRAVSGHRWYAKRGGNTIYAVRNIYVNGKWKRESLHRFILNFPRNQRLDHKNRDGLDCRKSNLRFCSASENGMNRTKIYAATSLYKGVSYHKKTNKFQARITVNGKQIYLGIHKSESEAAKIYDKAARKYHGQYACVNFNAPPMFMV